MQDDSEVVKACVLCIIKTFQFVWFEEAMHVFKYFGPNLGSGLSGNLKLLAVFNKLRYNNYE